MKKSTGLSDGTEKTAEIQERLGVLAATCAARQRLPLRTSAIRSLAIHVLREYVFSPAAGVRDFEPDLEEKNERSGRSNH